MAKAERLALVDPEYIHFVERFIEARSKALYDRIMADSYFKLMDAGVRYELSAEEKRRRPHRGLLTIMQEGNRIWAAIGCSFRKENL